MRTHQEPFVGAVELQAGEQRAGLVRLRCAFPVMQISFQLLLAGQKLARIVQPRPQARPFAQQRFMGGFHLPSIAMAGQHLQVQLAALQRQGRLHAR